MSIPTTIIMHVVALTQVADAPVDGDFGLIRLAVMIVVTLLVLVAIGVGIAIGVFLLAMAGALVSAGIVSSSVVVGLVTGRVSAGWRTFLILSSMTALTLLGAGGGWLFEHAANVHLAPSWAVIVGAAAGAMAGVLGALCFDWLLRLSVKRAASLRHAPLVQRLTQKYFPRLNSTNQPT